LTVQTQRIAHLTGRNWLLRLYDEVVRPARAAGHRLWLGGISLGAFMALRFAALYPEQIHGGHEWPVWRQLWENFLDRYLEP
jgi:pimeloyl-ACP methyl ester carboxylesterase